MKRLHVLAVVFAASTLTAALELAGCSGEEVKPAGDAGPDAVSSTGDADRPDTNPIRLPDADSVDSASGGEAGQASTLRAILGGGQEVPSVTTASGGGATVVVDASRSRITVTVALTGPFAGGDAGADAGDAGAPTAAHLHVGRVGENGPILLNVPAAGGTAQLTAATFPAGGAAGLATFAAAVQAVLEGRTYVNVHSAAQPGGEIRGQVGPVTLAAVLSGRQEQPAVVTGAFGTATLALNGAQDAITVSLNVSGVNVGGDGGISMAHVHAGAPAVASGGVVFDLAPLANPLVKVLRAADFRATDAGLAVGTFDQAVDALLSGRTYVNVHTNLNPGGLVRGHVGKLTLRTSMSSANEVPPADAGTGGAATATMDGLQTGFRVNVKHDAGAAFTMAHIHAGAVAQNGDILFTFNNLSGDTGADFSADTAYVGSSDSGTGIPGTSGAIDAVLTGRAYVNVHTTRFPAGEMRGQLTPQP